MAKQISIKFPRIAAGFYSITKDGEFVGYVMKEVDGKETNWYIFDDNVPDKDVAMLHPEDAIDAPDSLLREAKESAKNYFLAKPVEVEAIALPTPLPEAEWAESEPVEPEAQDLEDDDLIEDSTLFVSEDGEFEAFEDELDPFVEDDLEFDTIDMDELALA